MTDNDKLNSIRWSIEPIVHEKLDEGIIIELQWGWTAGMTEEDLKNWADDAPTGYDYMITNLDLVEELRDKLNVIIDKYKARNEELIKLADAEMDRKFPNLTETLLKLAEQDIPPTPPAE